MTSARFDWHLQTIVLCIYAEVQYMSPNERRFSQRPFRSEHSGRWGVSIIWAFWFWEHVHRASSYDSTTSCLGASLSSGNGGLYGYRKGRREGGGGKDGVFWVCEMVGDAHRYVFPRLSPPNQPPVLPPSLSSGVGVHSSWSFCASFLPVQRASRGHALSHVRTCTCSDVLFLVHEITVW